MKLLSIIVPSFNSQDYLKRCIESLQIGDSALEVIIINDGSTDKTGELAEELAALYPNNVIVIHQENKGHGGAINTGLTNAQGKYFKVIDSDDWVDQDSLISVLETLRKMEASHTMVDLLINNYVYEREGKSTNRFVHFHNILPEDEIFSWDKIERFPRGHYLMMHALIYRTEILNLSKLKLPEHTYYVDNLYVYLPLKIVRSISYINVDLYRYFIGREDQSVNEQTMIKKIDQQVFVNQMMIEATDWNEASEPASANYLIKHLEAVMSISSTLLNKIGTEEAMFIKLELWKYLERTNSLVYQQINGTIVAKLIKLTSRPTIWISNRLYRIVRTMAGY